MPLSTEEAVQRIKAEIIAPDWRLSAKRIESLAAAFACLQERFRTRKRLRDIITMAGNVLQYIKVKGDNSPPDSIDFLKEAMADIINLHEGDDDPERDERVFKKVFAHFQKLKERIRIHKARRQAVFSPEAAGPGSEEAVAAVRTLASLQENSVTEREEGEEREEDAGLPENGKEETSTDLGQHLDVGHLIEELQESLQRAEEVGEALRQILGVALNTGGKAGPDIQIHDQPAPLLPASAEPAQSGTGESYGDRQHEQPVEHCQPTTVQQIMLGEQPVALPSEGIALIRPLTDADREKYLREGQVPLRDFNRMFQGLSRQFQGVLAGVSGRKLKKISLPVISLQSFGIPELRDEQATRLLVLSHGQWHGVLFCTEVSDELHTMVKFRKAPDGDIAGLGYLEDGRELPVANLADFLRREGFLALV